ncbi:MAG: ATP synthase F0 subunit B [Oscillospiraceae bacterium]
MHTQIIAQMVRAVAQASSEMPEGSILHLDQQLLIEIAVTAVNLIVLVAVLAFVLYKPLKKFMAQRTEKVKERIEQSEKALQEANELRDKYEKLIEDIEEEREAILAEGRTASLERSEEIIADARKEAANIYRRSMEDLRMEQENSMDDMKKSIVEISTRMAAHFVTVSVDRETQDRYIEEAMSHLEETLWES